MRDLSASGLRKLADQCAVAFEPGLIGSVVGTLRALADRLEPGADVRDALSSALNIDCAPCYPKTENEVRLARVLPLFASEFERGKARGIEEAATIATLAWLDGVPVADIPDAIRQQASDSWRDLRAAVEHVCSAFEKDEAQGFRSKDRQFAISILRQALPAAPAPKCEGREVDDEVCPHAGRDGMGQF